MILHTLKNIKNISCSLAYKVVCIDDRFIKPVLYRGKNGVNKFIEAILKEYDYCKQIIKSHFNKNPEEDEQRFQSSNKCWICNKLFDVGDNKIDHCHVTGNCRGSAHWSLYINLKLTKRVLVIIHNLRGYDGHLIMKGIGKFDVKVSVITNGLEKCMAFTINNNLVFIDSMQLMNSSLDDFKYLSQEFIN